MVNFNDKNTYQINIIKDLYSGEFSETESMLQFMYFCYVQKDNKQFVEKFLEILTDEQKHHKILGELLFSLGESPTYFSSKNIPLSGIGFEYFLGLKNILSFALELKEKSIINYKIAINKITKLRIKQTLEQILVDEQKHKQILQNLMQIYSAK